MPARRIIVPVVCLILFVLVAYAIKSSQPEASTGKASKNASMLVKTQVLEPQAFTLTVQSFGVVQAKHRSELNALVSGQVRKVSPAFKAGGRVSEGDVLLSLDTSEYELALQEARSNLANAELALAEEKARSEQAKRDWNSRKDGLQGNDFTLRRPQLKAAEENLNTAQARLKLAQLNLERCQVRATFSGRIQNTFVEQGSVVSPGLLLASGYDTSFAEVRLAVASDALKYLNVPEGQGDLAQGSTVRFTNNLLKPAQVWEGRIIRSEAAIDSTTQQLYLVAEIEQPFDRKILGQLERHPLALGQYLEAEIVGKRLDKVIAIPSSAIYQGRYVYLQEDGRLQRRDVEIFWAEGEISLIATGLNEGDELIVTSLGLISSGTPVRTAEQVKDKAQDNSSANKSSVHKDASL
jgi:RND family efflux transporter MFP subunit